MKIVIEIDDVAFQGVLRLVSAGEGSASDVAIASGTPLPKNHGRLIDADALKAKLEEHSNLFVKAWGCFKDMPFSDKSRVDEIDSCISEILNAPTIIEEVKADES